MALVLSRLDHGNAVLVSLSAYLVRRPQSLLNAAAKLHDLRRSDYVTDTLVSFHWLRLDERIQYQIAAVTYKVLPTRICPVLPWHTRAGCSSTCTTMSSICAD